jgi:hypothetical protein
MNSYCHAKALGRLQKICKMNDLASWHICPAEPQVAQYNPDNPQNVDLYQPSRKISFIKQL